MIDTPRPAPCPAGALHPLRASMRYGSLSTLHAIRSAIIPLSGLSESAPVQLRFGCAWLTLRILLRALRVPLAAGSPPHLLCSGTDGQSLPPLHTQPSLRDRRKPNRGTGGWLTLAGYAESSKSRIFNRETFRRHPCRQITI
jgi:hypothetical protein